MCVLCDGCATHDNSKSTTHLTSLNKYKAGRILFISGYAGYKTTVCKTTNLFDRDVVREKVVAVN